MKNRFLITLTAFCVFFCAHLVQAEDQPELMALDEVEAGMEGVWRTVVSGTAIEEYPLKVLGVVENMVGPGRSLIICEALDPANILSGPVAGMSGSPVYIGGRLVGAYAYGFTWSKEQAIIGVTPIADMLEVFDRFDEDESSVARASRYPEHPSATELNGGSVSGNLLFANGLPSTEVLRSYLQPLPTALNVSGISPQVLAQFEPEFRALGMEPALVPMGRTDRKIEPDLQPGSAVAGVLLDGDFNIAGTGTVTYRDGDRLLAFGHPFFGMGATDLPMAAAEVMTVIRSVQSSFKLSNTGPVIGAIYQDRLSAIAGKIGREAPVVQFALNVENDDGFQRTYRGNLFRHPQLSPLVSAMAIGESLTRTMEASSQQTFFVRSTWEIDGFEPVVLEDVATGPNSPMLLAMRHLDFYRELSDNFFAAPDILSITYDISFRDEWLISELESAFIDRQRVKPGESVTLDLVLRNYRGERTRQRIEIPVPADLLSERTILFIGDARSAQAHDPDFTVRPRSLEQVLDRAKKKRGDQSIYVKLLRPSRGLRVLGEKMPDLPPSVASAFRSSKGEMPVSEIAHATLWEMELPLTAEFRGQKTFQLEIER